jgi:hypothetical protein
MSSAGTTSFATTALAGLPGVPWSVTAKTSRRRLEAAGPVARDRDVDLAIIGQDRLRAGAVAAVAAATAGWIALLVAEMLAQLRSQRPLDQRLLQPLEKPVRTRQVFKASHS